MRLIVTQIQIFDFLLHLLLECLLKLDRQCLQAKILQIFLYFLLHHLLFPTEILCLILLQLAWCFLIFEFLQSLALHHLNLKYFLLCMYLNYLLHQVPFFLILEAFFWNLFLVSYFHPLLGLLDNPILIHHLFQVLLNFVLLFLLVVLCVDFLHFLYFHLHNNQTN